MKLRIAVAGVISATMVTAASAQPTPRDHRTPPTERDQRDHRDRNDPVRDHRGPETAPPPEAPPPAPPPDTHGGRDSGHHREWKLDRPVVSSYWPMKGKVGSRVMIRGQNFAPDTAVVWGDTPIAGVSVTPTEITFVVPAGAASGSLALSVGHGRNLPIGAFDVADFDADAEMKRGDDDRRHKAEAIWSERQKQLAKDEATRQSEMTKQRDERTSTRESRRAGRATEIKSKWDHAFLGDPETQAELTLHAQRLAHVQRMRDLAETKSNGKLVVRIEVAQTKENERHDQRMAALHTGFKIH
jgi:IPT/TIG domain